MNEGTKDKIMSVLPEENRHSSSAWDSVMESERTIENFQARLTAVEDNKLREGNGESMAFEALMNNNIKSYSIRRKFQGKCSNFNEVGHMADKCRITKKCRISNKLIMEKKTVISEMKSLRKINRSNVTSARRITIKKDCFKNKKVSFHAVVLTTTKENTLEEEYSYSKESKDDIDEKVEDEIENPENEPVENEEREDNQENRSNDVNEDDDQNETYRLRKRRSIRKLVEYDDYMMKMKKFVNIFEIHLRKTRKEDGRHVARIVVRGCQQKSEMDFKDIFSPVVESSSLRWLLAIAAQNNLQIQTLNVKTAFPNGNLENEIYMTVPKEYNMPGKSVSTE
ncbi:hypothetical protein JTB14_001906 [Gonioctena quinquepunctata]|nr:hypothetical protein JTB14_001906 [Gonioctena quinquepunctata]